MLSVVYGWHGWIANASFDPTELGPIQASLVHKLLLGQSSLSAIAVNIPAGRFA